MLVLGRCLGFLGNGLGDMVICESELVRWMEKENFEIVENGLVDVWYCVFSCWLLL